jgi:hypothetical protein
MLLVSRKGCDYRDRAKLLVMRSYLGHKFTGILLVEYDVRCVKR